MVSLLASFSGTERFHLLRMIGQGGMGLVYEAFDASQGVPVALKVLPLVSPERLLRFKREFRAASEIHHEHLVRLGELVRAGDHWFFTMELVHGVDVLSYVRGPFEAGDLGSQRTLQDSTQVTPIAGAPEAEARRDLAPKVWGAHFDEARLRRCALQLAEALSALHRAGCVHRDVKPSNVMVTPEGRTVLLDFGLASAGGAETSMFSAGTPLYMAPEQATQRPATSATDWYGFGVVLFELLTGTLPFHGHVYEVISAKQNGAAPSLKSVEPRAPDDLASLVDALLMRLPSARPTEEQVFAALGATRLPTRPSLRDQQPHDAASLVGREPEWAQLAQLFAHVRDSGEAVALVLRGESGVGKSTLVRHFSAAQASADAAYTFRGRCHERELVPFNAVDGLFDAVSHVLRHLPDDAASAVVPARAGVLAQVFPVMARVPAIARAELPGASLDRRELRSWLFGAARALFYALGKQRPVLLFVDDLQWADDDSRALLSEILRPPDGPRVLLVCTLRTQSALARASDQRVFSKDVDERTFTLGNLSADSARSLAAQLLTASAGAADDSARIALESGGHPLFLRELAEEALGAHHSSFDLSLDGVLKRRIERLLEGPRRVLSVLAVAGTPVSLEVLRSACAMASEPLAQALHALRSARLVHSFAEAHNDGLDISHERVRRAVHEGLSQTDVRTLHLGLARSLEACGESARSAWHWHEAGDRERAATHYRSAGLRAMTALAFAEAVSHLRAAQELGRYDSAAASALAAELADALASAGRGAESARYYRLAAQDTAPSRAIEFKRRAAEELVRSGYLEEGLSVAREVLSDAKLPMKRSPFRSLIVERTRLKLRGLKLPAEVHGESEAQAHALARVDLCWSFFCGLVLTDHVQGAYFQAKALSLALASGDRYRVARALAAEAAYTSSRGPRHRERTRVLFARAEQLTLEVDLPQATGTLLLMQGIAAHMTGRFSAASDALAQASALFRERCRGVSWELDAARQFWLECAFYTGRLDELRECVVHGLREAEDRGSIYSSTNMCTGLPNAIWLMDDAPGRARDELARGMAQWSSHGFHVQHWYALIAEVQADLYEGQGESAYARVERGVKALARSHLLRVTHIGAAAAHLRGRAALAAARTRAPGEGRRALLAVVEQCELALTRDRTAWANALGQLLARSRARLAGEHASDAQVDALQQQLLAADLPLFAFALSTIMHGDGSALAARGVRDPARFAAMLMPA